MSYYQYGIEKYARALPGVNISGKLKNFLKRTPPVKEVPKALNLRSALYGAAGGAVGGALGNTMYNAQKEQPQPYTMYNNSIPQ